MSNIENNSYESVIYLQYYFLIDMCKEYNIKPRIYIGDSEYFKRYPDARAYHTSEIIVGVDDQKRYVPKICYNPEYMKNNINLKGIIELLNDSFHELEHEVQAMQMKNEKLDNPQALLWAKEFLVRKVVGRVFYDTNYWNVFHERDARDYAFKRIDKVVKEYIDPMKRAVKKEDASYDPNMVFDNVEIKENKSTTDSSDKGKIEYKKESAIDLLDAVSTEYIKAYPYLINDYPVLKNIYTEKGQKKLLPPYQFVV